MLRPADEVAFQLEYLHQVIELDGDAGVQTWLRLFKAALDRSRFLDCEQMLLVARGSPRFGKSQMLRSVIAHNKGLLRLFQGRLDEAEKRSTDLLTNHCDTYFR